MAINVTFTPAGRTVNISGLSETQVKSLKELLSQFYIPASADTGLAGLRSALANTGPLPGSTKRGMVRIQSYRGGRHSYKLA